MTCTNSKTIAAAFPTAGSATAGNLRPRHAERDDQRIDPRVRKLHGQLTAREFTGTRQRMETVAGQLLRQSIPDSVENGELDSASRGRVTFKVDTGLQQWSLTKSSSVPSATYRIPNRAADLLKSSWFDARQLLERFRPILSSTARSLIRRAMARSGLASARISGEPIRSVDLQFQGTGKQIARI